METDVHKNLFSLVVAALALVALNVLVWIGVQNGQLAPFDSTWLWGAFVVLDIISLLWAFSLLGLQPMVLAISYTAGGYLAYQGTRGIAGVSMAEVTTAGATYGAVGAMVVGNFTTKVRLIFFRKEQIPFVFVFTALLMVDGFMNSRVSGAGHQAVISTLLYPFTVAGVLVGLIWMLLMRVDGFPKRAKKAFVVEAAIQNAAEEKGGNESELSDDESQLMIQIPAKGTVEEEVEPAAILLEVSEPEPIPGVHDEKYESPVVSKEKAPVDTPEEEQFFPLEIDKEEEFVELPEPSSSLVDLAALIVDEPVEPEILIKSERALEKYPIPEVTPAFVESKPGITSMSEFESFPVVGSVSVEIKKKDSAKEASFPPVPPPVKESSSNDWLNGHLDLLSKINNEN